MYLKGSDSELWKDSKLNELMTMEQPTSDDTSSSTIRVVKLYHNIIGRFIHVCLAQRLLVAVECICLIIFELIG